MTKFDGGDESRVQALMAEVERLREELRQSDLMAGKAENERLREQIAWTVQRCNEAMGDGFSGTPNSAVAAVCDEVQWLRNRCSNA